MSDNSTFEPNRREPALGGNSNPALSGDEPYLSFDMLLPGVRDGIDQADRTIRIGALAKLRADPDAAIPILAQLLRTSPESRTRQRCAAMLGQIRNAKAVPALLDALESEDAKLRRIVAWALGHIGGLSAAPALRELAQHDPDIRVRTAAITSLGEVGDIEAAEFLLELEGRSSPIAIAAAGALKLIRVRCPVESLAAQLLVGNARMRAWAGQLFLDRRSDGDWTGDHIRLVEKLLGVEQPYTVRHRAVVILGSIDHEQAQSILLSLLGDLDEQIRADVIAAIDWNDVPDATEQLFQYFEEAFDSSNEHYSYPVCSAALNVLGHLDRPGVDEFLHERLLEGRAWGMLGVLRARNDPLTPATIVRILKELTDPSLRVSIIGTLTHEHWPAPEITVLLTDIFRHSSSEEERYAMLWSVHSHPDLLSDMVEALERDPSIRVRREIAYIMHDFCHIPEVEATLRRILAQDTDDILRANAAFALAVSGADDAPEILKHILESCHEEEALRRLAWASEVFSEEDGSRLAYLQQIYQMTSYSSARCEVLQVWGLPDLPGAIEFITQVLEQDISPEVRYRAVQTLHHEAIAQNTAVTENAAVLHALIAALDDTAVVQFHREDPTTQVCQIAVHALRRIHTPEALAALEDWEHRTSLIE
ncbi:MAG: HEAT repeat domain-containing protein [Anaerolineae bacterium]|nr:HEAT repeat domain-containing protein [Anaerolineae bacterium]